jgi:pyruvate formate lyase activating enzyme
MSLDVFCSLCPKRCRIPPGHSGDCRVRVNRDGALKAVVYGHPSALHLDPIEKKPLFHFLPGSSILSVAAVGCNLHCKNCQNWEISQANPEDIDAYALSPRRLVRAAGEVDSRCIAYTYTEPVVFYEYTLDTAREARARGLKNVLVSAGYVNTGPFRELLTYIDAANIDCKAFSEEFYRDICDGALWPVLDAMVCAKEMGVHLEVTNLLIPTLNDSRSMIRDLVVWIRNRLGPDTPLHFSRFRPSYRMRNLPPTPAETLENARAMALDAGLHFVYIGNLYTPGAETTRCPDCGARVIVRKGYRVLENNLSHGACPVCARAIEGVWSDENS